LAVLEAVRSRIDVRLIFTTPEAISYTPPVLAVLKHGRELLAHLQSLHIIQVRELINQVLGKTIDARTASYLHKASAGNPRLLVRIAETAALSGLLAATKNKLGMVGDSLWNIHLRGTTEALLSELPPGELDTVHAMALPGGVNIAPSRSSQTCLRSAAWNTAGFSAGTQTPDTARKRLSSQPLLAVLPKRSQIPRPPNT
jgi:hypothetical protein